MMIDPPIDELTKDADGCRYALACVVAKRARQLIGQEEEKLEESGMKAISLAAKELHNGDIKISKD